MYKSFLYYMYVVSKCSGGELDLFGAGRTINILLALFSPDWGMLRRSRCVHFFL